MQFCTFPAGAIIVAALFDFVDWSAYSYGGWKVSQFSVSRAYVFVLALSVECECPVTHKITHKIDDKMVYSAEFLNRE